MTVPAWNLDDISAAQDVLYEKYDEWDLAGVGAASDDDGIDHALAAFRNGSSPHPELIAWRASLKHPNMVWIEEYGVPRPGEGPDVETPPGQQGIPL
jgi:hypothetical protein